MKRLIAILMTLIMVFGLSSAGACAAEETTWSFGLSMPTARSYPVSAVIGDKIYVMGGMTGTGYLKTVEIYHSTTNKWTTGTPMPSARVGFTCSVVGNKIYVIGGAGSSGSYLNTVDIFDTVSDSWTTGAPLPTVRSHLASAVIEGKIYLIGGSGLAGVGVTNIVEIYDPMTDTWSTGTPMPNAKFGFTATVIENKIYAIGGINGSSVYNTVEIYNTFTNTWTTGSPMSTARAYSASSAIGGRIYVMGGYASPNRFSTVEIYNPTTDSWTTGPSLIGPTKDATSSVIGERISLIGGVRSDSISSRMEYLQVIPDVTTPTQPRNLTAIGGNSKVDLSWGAVMDAASYNVKRSTTAGGQYTPIANVTGTSYTDTDVVNGTTYYYVVTAVSAGGESTNSNEASATPQAPSTSTGKALLVITMTNGLEKEYDLQMSEVNAFINWYSSNGSGFYMFNKNFNLGPFMTRVDYIAHDKIQNFEVMQYQ
jgi:N-acetylneuraminic acid mutarotase